MKFWIPVVALLLALSPLSVVHPVRVSGISMEPTLPNGSLHFVLRAWCAGNPRRGEVWLVEGPQGPAIKRVIGLPGEHLEQRQGELILGERRLEEAYVSYAENRDAGPWDCGSGYLMLGDNRRASHDGRSWGPLDGVAFQGKVLGMP